MAKQDKIKSLYEISTEVRDVNESSTRKDVSDHLMIDGDKHFIDVVDPDSGRKKFRPGDKVQYVTDDGTRYQGTISKNEHPDGDMFEVDIEHKSK